MFKREVADPDGPADEIARTLGAEVLFRYRSSIRGIAVRLPDARVDALRANPDVDFVEQDQIAYGAGVQSNPSWALDRVDQRASPLDGSYTWGPDGTRVRVYVLDSGIQISNPDFSGRAEYGTDLVSPSAPNPTCTQDAGGHGTVVAGLVGGATYGVAKNVRLISVRVLPCDLTQPVSTILAGVDWVTANRVLPAVANMSIAVPKSDALNAAIASSIAAGVTYVAAAGNAASDACAYSPASAPGIIDVAATDQSDQAWSSSNYGPCVDVYAPGAGVTSIHPTLGTVTWSGTSLAAPHVSGAAAIYLSAHPGAAASEVKSALVGNATSGVLFSVPSGTGTPNRLLYTAFMNGTLVAPAPVATVTVMLAGTSVSVGQTTQATAVLADAGGNVLTGRTVTWSSSNTAVASVSPAGVVSALVPGSATITATSEGRSGSAGLNVTGTVAALTASFTYACAGSLCRFDAGASTNAVSYTWNFGDGSSSVTLAVPTATHDYGADARTFHVYLTVTGADGATRVTKDQLVKCRRGGVCS